MVFHRVLPGWLHYDVSAGVVLEIYMSKDLIES